MLKKLLEFTGDPQTVMTVVTVCTLAISIIALIVDEPSPGVAYVMGFLNAAQKTGEGKYLEQAEAQWAYIRRAIIDPRPGGEWFWYVLPDGTPARDPIVEPWKCPYHNGRMALEVLRRCGG